jgi:hypothetical protein|tara:strand:+ start:587 stop:1237 length:651 start_codon:yes stop_codon:yes gene_type:complete
MKKLFLSTLLLALSFGVSAQSFSWGAKVNVGSPNLKIKDIQTDDNIAKLLDDTDAVLTYQLGVFTRFMFAGIYVQPEAMFSSSKTEMKFENIFDENNTSNNVVGEMKLNKLDVPVMIGKRFMKILRINAGPVFSYILSQNIGQSGTKEAWNEINAEYKNATVGLQYGIGVDIAMINIDLRVEKGFQAISENLTIGETSFAADQRLEQIMLSVGMKF